MEHHSAGVLGMSMPTVWAALRYWCAKLSFLHFREDLSMKSDIEIAQEARMKPITQIAAQLGLEEESVIPYGRYKAKIDLWCSTRFRQQGCGLCCKDSTPPGCLSRRYSYKNHP